MRFARYVVCDGASNCDSLFWHVTCAAAGRASVDAPLAGLFGAPGAWKPRAARGSDRIPEQSGRSSTTAAAILCPTLDEGLSITAASRKGLRSGPELDCEPASCTQIHVKPMS